MQSTFGRKGCYAGSRLKTLKELQDPLDSGNLPDRLLRLSRDMAQYLRHTGGQNGFPALDRHGWISVRVLRTVRAGTLYHASLDDILCVVAESYSKERRRFEIRRNHGELEVRALHNHTLNVVISPQGRRNAYRDMKSVSGVPVSSPDSRPVPRSRPVHPLRLHSLRSRRATIGSTTATTGSRESPIHRNTSPRRQVVRDGRTSSSSFRLDCPDVANHFGDARIRDLSCSELDLKPPLTQAQEPPPRQPPQSQSQPQPQPQPQPLAPQPQQLPPQPLAPQPQQLPPHPLAPQPQGLPQQPPQRQPPLQPQKLPTLLQQLPTEPQQMHQQDAQNSAHQRQQQQIQFLRERLRQYHQQQQNQCHEEQQQPQEPAQYQQLEQALEAQQPPLSQVSARGVHAELRSHLSFVGEVPGNAKGCGLLTMPVLADFSGVNYDFKCLVVQYGDVVEFVLQEGPWSLCRLGQEEGWLPTEFLLAPRENILEPTSNALAEKVETAAA